MMEYKEFKAYVIEHLKEYLPAEYQNMEIREELIPKVNGYREAVVFQNGDEGTAAPTLYFADLFEAYQDCKDEEAVLLYIAELFISGTRYASAMVGCIRPRFERDNIIFMLVNTERNQELLNEMPNRAFMDMSILYRFIMPLPDGTFNAAYVSYDNMKDLRLTEQELYDLAMENTPRYLPCERLTIDDEICGLTNEPKALGASTMLYPGVLEELAEEMDSDFYIIPSSIHEVLILPVGRINFWVLSKTLREGNGTIVPEREVLSNHILRYSREMNMVVLGETLEKELPCAMVQ